MRYEFLCVNPDCSTERFEEILPVQERDTAQYCPQCEQQAKRVLFYGGQQVRHLNDTLITDFDGSGEKAYSRQEYLDECKRRDRDPVGFLWKGGKGLRI